MALKPTPITDEIFRYVVAHSVPPEPIRDALIAETATLSDPDLQTSPDESAFLTLITKISGARTALEFGTFTGLSSLSIARGLPVDGKLICCDVSAEWTAIARKYWERAGVADRIELRLGPALDTVRAMPAEPQFDLVFLDADKPNHPAYWEEVVPRVRSGGIILTDNTLMGGRIVDADGGEGDQAMRRFNDLASTDPRVESVLLTIADGLTLSRKK